MPRRDEPKRYQMPMESSAVGRIDARLDTLDTEVSAIEATLAAQVLIDADFDARITALEGGGGGGGVSAAKALTFGFMRC